MASANTTIILANIVTDSVNLRKDLTDALGNSTPANWSLVLNDLSSLTADTTSLMVSSSAWANALGGSAAYSAAQQSWKNILTEYQQGGISAVKATDLLNFISGESNAIATASLAVAAATGIPAPAALGVTLGVLGSISGAEGAMLANTNPNLTLGQLAGNLAAGFDSSGDAIINSTNGTSAVVYNSGLPAGYQSAVQYFSGWNGTGSLKETVITTTAGWSQVQINNPSTGVSYQATNYSSANGLGSVTWQLQNFTNGTSSQSYFTNLSAGLASVTQNYSGLNGSGTLTSNVLNTQAGWSQVQTLTNLPSGVTYEATNHAGLNGAGAVTWDLKNNSNGTSSTTSYTGLSAGISSLIQNYSSANASGTLLNNVLNLSAGGSQLQQFTNLPSGVSYQATNFSGSNATGSVTWQLSNNTSGTSTETFNTGLASGIASVVQTFSAQNGGGSLLSNLLNTSAGWSQLQNFANLPNGVTEQITSYSGLGGSGAMTSQIINKSDGSSIETTYSGLASGISSLIQTFSGPSATGTLLSNLLNLTSGGSQLQQFTNLPAGVAQLVTNYPSPNGVGMPTWQMENLNNGQSQIVFTTGLPAGASKVTQNYSAANAGGLMTSQIIQELNGNVATLNFNYDSNGNQTSFTEQLVNSGGTPIANGTFTPDGTEISGNIGGSIGDPSPVDGIVIGGVVEVWGGGGDFGGDGGGDGFAGNQTTVARQLSSGTSTLAQENLAKGNISGAVAAQLAFTEVQAVLAKGGTNEVATGSIWNTGSSKTVTWNLAQLGVAQSPWSSTINTSAEIAAVQQAFATWGAASGLNFQEVANSAQANITLGFSNLDTANTGNVGLTAYQSKNGQLQSAQIELEDPTQDVFSADGTLTYAGTSATFEQVLLHEIGHAIGLADNNNANSIENYYLGASNQGLSSADAQAAKALYSGQASGLQSINQLIAAMSGAAPAPSAQATTSALFTNPAPSVLAMSH